MIARSLRFTVVAAVVSTLTLAAPSPALTLTGRTSSRCGSFPDLVTAGHAQAVRREQTLSTLTTIVQARRDPFALNGAQLATLQNAKSAVAALDAKIENGCYATRTALIADITTLFDGQRVYWLHVPQTQVIVAADYLAEAQTRLTDAATRLAAGTGSDAVARADVAAMQAALATAAAKLGTAPTASSAVTAVAALQPARDMTADVAALNAARASLTAARVALVAARAAGRRAIARLRA